MGALAAAVGSFALPLEALGLLVRERRLWGPAGLPLALSLVAVTAAVENAKAGQVRYRTDKAGIVHCTIGKVDFEVGALVTNLAALLADLIKLKPASSKGIYLQKVTLTSTMGPGITIDHGPFAR